MYPKFKPRRGFILLELLVVVALLLFLFSLYYTPSQQYAQSLYAKQVKMATQILAADMRAFQQNTLFNEDKVNRMVILDTKDGYYVESNQGTAKRYVYFNQIGCDGVYFASCPTKSIRFTVKGAPVNKVAGDYVLKHRKNATAVSTITIQVASGRVDVNES